MGDCLYRPYHRFQLFEFCYFLLGYQMFLNVSYTAIASGTKEAFAVLQSPNELSDMMLAVSTIITVMIGVVALYWRVFIRLPEVYRCAIREYNSIYYSYPGSVLHCLPIVMALGLPITVIAITREAADMVYNALFVALCLCDVAVIAAMLGLVWFAKHFRPIDKAPETTTSSSLER